MKRTILVMVVVASVVIPDPALATDFTWTGSFSTLFQAPPNWSPFTFGPPAIFGPPNATGMGTFDLGNATYTVTFNASHTSLRTRIGDDAVTFNLGGHTYTLTSQFDPPSIVVGTFLGDDATLTLTNGILAGHRAAIARPSVALIVDASLVVDSGALFTLSDRLDIGVGDQGSLIVQNGGDVNTSYCWMGVDGINGFQGSGAATVSGPGSTWETVSLLVGYQGPATLDIHSSGSVSGEQAGIGKEAGVVASVSVDGEGSAFDMENYATIGDYGSGSLTITNGADVDLGNDIFGGSTSTIGYQAGGVGNVTVTGTGSSFKCGGVYVGFAGEGHLTLTDGATGSAFGFGSTFIAGYEGGVGTMLVSGEGTAWNAGNSLGVGRGGTGSMTVDQGADVAAGSVRVGYFGEGVPIGTLTIDGAGSTLASTVDFTLGGTNTGGPQGDGTLIVSNGASITHQGLNTPDIIIWDTSDIILDGGSIAAPAITVHGALSGNGTISADVTSDGMIAPGTSPGTLAINGTCTLLPGGALTMEVGGATPGIQHDRLNVSGNVTAGGTLNLSLAGGFTPAPGQQFVIVNSSGGAITGTFATVNPPNTWQTIYSAQNVIVQLINDCPADISPTGGDNSVNVSDLLAVITSWGSCAVPCPPRCAADIAPIPGGDCAVNVADLLAVITSWGACP